MTGQDAILDASALKWEAHVRATIIEGVDAPEVVDDQDRAMATMHNESPFRLQLLKTPRKREFLVRRVHERNSPNRPFGAAWVLNIGIISPKRQRPAQFQVCARRGHSSSCAAFMASAHNTMPILTASWGGGFV